MSVNILTNPAVRDVFNSYPKEAKRQMLHLRTLIFNVAEELNEISEIEETLKWGEPSYLTKNGSTIRIDWKSKSPDQYAMYFKCTSKLVPTFKQLFWDDFQFEGNRAIIFKLEEEVPSVQLKKCIEAALTYHQVKHLDNLAMRMSPVS